MPWVHRVTTNHCLNMLRDARRQAEPMPSEIMPEPRDDDFEDSVVSKDFADRLMERQPEELKAPVILYHMKGMEQSRVAAWLGVSRRTVLYRPGRVRQACQGLRGAGRRRARVRP